jgi:hypothetical protein
MKGRNIAESGEPFWIFREDIEINSIEKPPCSIPAAGGEDRPQARIVEHFLQPGEPLSIIPGKLVMPPVYIPGLHGPSFPPEGSCEYIQIRVIDPSRRCDNTHAITGMQKCREFHHCFKLRIFLTNDHYLCPL